MRSAYTRILTLLLILLGFAGLPAAAQTSKSSAKSPTAAAAKTSPATTGETAPKPAANAPIQAYFGPKAADDPQSVLFNLLRFLDTAKVSIFGSVHEIDMVVVAQKLAERADAGVDVEIVVESNWINLPKDR